MAAMAAGAGTLARVAVGCTGRDESARSAPGLERELRILAPRDAFAADLLDRFSVETGVRVAHEQYAGRGAVLPPDDSGFDLIAFMSPAAASLRAAGRIVPLDRALVPSVSDLLPMFQPDGAELVAIPYAWEATGIAWRPADLPDVPGAAPTTWCVFFEPALAGRMTLLDGARDVLGAMLLLRGRSVNTADAAVLQQARDDALASRRFLSGFRAAETLPLMADGIAVSQARSSEAARAIASDPGISFAIPREGGPVFAAQVALAAAAAHPRAAHAFLDYILHAEISTRIAAASGRLSPLAGSGSPLPAERLEPVLDAGQASALYDRYWTEIQSA